MYIPFITRADPSERASELFDYAWRIGKNRRGGAKNAPKYLPQLYSVRAGAVLSERLAQGTQEIYVGQITGTYANSNFDAEFHPVHLHMKPRWVSVATVMLSDPQILPPIEVVLFLGAYYVDDGHHRVSVSKMLGRSSILARVILWKTA